MNPSCLCVCVFFFTLSFANTHVECADLRGLNLGSPPESPPREHDDRRDASESRERWKREWDRAVGYRDGAAETSAREGRRFETVGARGRGVGDRWPEEEEKEGNIYGGSSDGHYKDEAVEEEGGELEGGAQGEEEGEEEEGDSDGLRQDGGRLGGEQEETEEDEAEEDDESAAEEVSCNGDL